MRKKTNKSAAIRDAHQANPTATPAQIIETLAVQKIKVSPQLVSNVISRLHSKPKRRSKANATAGLTVHQLESAAEFARTAGGLENAVNALAFLTRLR